jgi:hypothetical protein
VRSQRERDRRSGRGAAAIAGSMGLWVLARAAHRPIDTFAIAGALVAATAIIVNAVFLQSGLHPSPIFANPPPAVLPSANDGQSKTADGGPKPPEPAIVTRPIAQVAPARTPQSIPARRNDPIADLIGPSARIFAVQRALSEYGYGQIKPSGMLDTATSAAIEKFEREHKLPASGRVSDRLVKELTAMVGHPIE